jgi:hypothetical protein
MDMKKILQALDKKSSMLVEDSSDMKKFMSIVTEGASPHKVSLPVQMAMDHYSTPATVIHKSPSLFKKYFAEAEDAVMHKQVEQKQLMRQYARIIAERVQEKTPTKQKGIKESSIPGHSPGFTGGIGPGLQSNQPVESTENPKDVVKLDIPLLIRLLEYAREDAKTDMDLHKVTEKLIDFSKSGGILTMNNYDAIVGEQELLDPPSIPRGINKIELGNNNGL